MQDIHILNVSSELDIECLPLPAPWFHAFFGTASCPTPAFSQHCKQWEFMLNLENLNYLVSISIYRRYFTVLTILKCCSFFCVCQLCPILFLKVDAVPKDDGTLLERRRELQREVEISKRNLTQEVSNYSSSFDHFLAQPSLCSVKVIVMYTLFLCLF